MTRKPHLSLSYHTRRPEPWKGPDGFGFYYRAVWIELEGVFREDSTDRLSCSARLDILMPRPQLFTTRGVVPSFADQAHPELFTLYVNGDPIGTAETLLAAQAALDVDSQMLCNRLREIATEELGTFIEAVPPMSSRSLARKRQRSNLKRAVKGSRLPLKPFLNDPKKKH